MAHLVGLMKFNVLTIFPEMFVPFWEHGIVKRAIDRNLISASTINIRDFAKGKHRVTDDRPYGGGSGMVVKPEPLANAIRAAKENSPSLRTILLTPQGRRFTQKTAGELAVEEGLILVCGRYEGVDERICHDFVDDEISIGDYVLTGGELASMIIIDAVVRLIPDALGNADSAENDSFSNSLLAHAQYTRPRTFEGEDVPGVLLTGDHQRIEEWRLEESIIRTFLKRQDLLKQRALSEREIDILKKWCRDIEKIIYAQSSRGVDTLPGDR
jgi:tRNA (guanine37-N1)-methyltransferase